MWWRCFRIDLVESFQSHVAGTCDTRFGIKPKWWYMLCKNPSRFFIDIDPFLLTFWTKKKIISFLLACLFVIIEHISFIDGNRFRRLLKYSWKSLFLFDLYNAQTRSVCYFERYQRKLTNVYFIISHELLTILITPSIFFKDVTWNRFAKIHKYTINLTQ